MVFKAVLTGSRSMSDDLELAFLIVDAADAVTSEAWTPAA